MVGSQSLAPSNRQLGRQLAGSGLLLTDFGFYLYNLIGGWVHGYGLFFHLFNFSDPILWTAFLIGYVNFFAAGYLIVHLIRNRPNLPAPSPETRAPTD